MDFSFILFSFPTLPICSTGFDGSAISSYPSLCMLRISSILGMKRQGEFKGARALPPHALTMRTEQHRGSSQSTGEWKRERKKHQAGSTQLEALTHLVYKNHPHLCTKAFKLPVTCKNRSLCTALFYLHECKPFAGMQAQ